MRTLSPSAAERWIACPASHYIAGKLPPLPSTSSAEEGTLAHEFAAWYAYKNISLCFPGVRALCIPPSEPEMALATAEMLEGAQSYADAVLAKICEVGELVAFGIEAPLLGFDSLDPDASPFLPGCEGTAPAVKGRADFIAHFANGDVLVADYKFGEHIVYAKGNSQMTIYGIMARDAAGLDGRVHMGIIQPRAETAELLDLAASWYTIPADAVDAVRGGLAGAVNAAITADASTLRTPGPHCGFCPARSTCLASVAERLLLAAVAAGEASESNDATDEQLGAWLSACKAVDKVSEDLARIAKARIAAGATIPGYRLQSKRTLTWATTAQTVAEQAVDIAAKLGCQPNELLKLGLRSPADMKKSIDAERIASCTTEQKSTAIIQDRTTKSGG